MSKSEKAVKGSTTSQLRKELGYSGKVFQNLTSSLEKLESTLTEAETALTNERSLKEELSSVQRQNTGLREELDKAKSEHQGEIVSFATANLKLTQEYRSRLDNLESEHEFKIEEYQRREEVMKSKWQQEVELGKAEIQRLKQVESLGRREIESQLRGAKEGWQKKEEQFQIDLKQRDHQIAEHSNKTKTLIQELTDHETMLRGRDKEIQKLGARLSALEAFSPQDGTDK
jgi:chromosome segregation ATPase